jgi:CheY-like chemotaxis protein
VVRQPLPAGCSPASQRADARLPEAPPPPRPAERGCTILVCDDNADGAEALAYLLKTWGHTVHVANDGSSALAQAAESRPEVVVLDIAMPDMDGYEVARRIRALPGMASAMLIALTGFGQARDHARTREAGFDHHLLKPADVRQLHGLIESRLRCSPR